MYTVMITRCSNICNSTVYNQTASCPHEVGGMTTQYLRWNNIISRTTESRSSVSFSDWRGCNDVFSHPGFIYQFGWKTKSENVVFCPYLKWNQCLLLNWVVKNTCMLLKEWLNIFCLYAWFSLRVETRGSSPLVSAWSLVSLA